VELSPGRHQKTKQLPAKGYKMKDLDFPKIRITQKVSASVEHIGYLVEDRPDKFIILNESKRIELHFPKMSYEYEVISESG